jgi:anthranilate phosphoribosyltransferase
MFPGLIDKLQHRVDLSVDEAAGAMEAIMDGRAQPSQIAGFLVGLAMKGERPDEIVGLACTMRARATKLSKSFAPVFDTCGTGGDGAHTFNVSTVSALVLAACGVRVAKHGNRSASSRCGSADLFEALGVNVGATPAIVERCLEGAGIGFLFAQVFHPSMKHAAATRKELGVRTAFNLLGPLTNPAGASRQVIGVSDPAFLRTIAGALARLGADKALVVSSADGLDEMSTAGTTTVVEVDGTEIHSYELAPEDVGLPRSTFEAVAGGTPEQNAAVTRRIFAGEDGPARDLAALNAGGAIYVAGRVDSLEGGVRAAEQALDSGAAAEALDTLVALTQQLAPS